MLNTLYEIVKCCAWEKKVKEKYRRCEYKRQPFVETNKFLDIDCREKCMFSCYRADQLINNLPKTRVLGLSNIDIRCNRPTYDSINLLTFPRNMYVTKLILFLPNSYFFVTGPQINEILLSERTEWCRWR